MRVAENHHLAAFDIATQAIHIHGETVLGANQRIKDNLSAAVLRHYAEGVIDRLLNKDLVAFVGEALHAQVDTAYHTWDIGNLLAFQVHSELFQIPLAYVIPIGIVTAGIAYDTLLQTTLHGFQNEGWGTEVHIGYPHGYYILAAATPVNLVVLHAVRTKARNNLREIVFH